MEKRFHVDVVVFTGFRFLTFGVGRGSQWNTEFMLVFVPCRPHGLMGGVGAGWGGRVGLDNYKHCGCIEERETLWLLSRTV